MPRYFFDVENRDFFRDREGQELSGLVAAKNEATRALGDALKDDLNNLEHGDIAINVRDESGRLVLRVALSLSVTHPIS